MASVQITAWDVASLLGLRYAGFKECTDKYGDVSYSHVFSIHEKIIEVNEYVYDNEREALEGVSQELLTKLGRHLAKIID
jgi:hypothetical protein